MNPIISEVVKHALLAICETMALTVRRSARSHVVRENKDFSVALYDAQGRLIGESSGLPGHLMAMGLAMKKYLKLEELLPIKPGDVIMCNDPLIGPHHIPDVHLASALFHEGQIVGYAGVLAHHADMGGMVAGSVAGNAKEIFQEGLRFPPVKLYHEGVPDAALFKFITANVRQPVQVATDLKAQVSAIQLGQRRFNELLIDQFGMSVTLEAINDLIAYSERRIRQNFEEIPDGTYDFEEYVDDDGISDSSVRICTAVTVKGSDIHVDFTGSSPQVPGAINMYFPTTLCTVQYILRALCDADIPNNEGCFFPISAYAPVGTIVNPRFPAACGYHLVIHHRISDCILGAMSKVVPERVVAGSYGCTPKLLLYGGFTEKEARYIFHDTMAGGLGAGVNRDGIDGSTMHTSNSRNTPIEVGEADYPVLWRRYECVQDSGGVGKYRGGLGIIREMEILDDHALLSISADRFKFPAHGILGGEPGRVGSATITHPDGSSESLRSKAANMTMHRGDIISVRNAGGGGCGSGFDRDALQVLLDVRSGKVSIGSALHSYGVVIKEDLSTIDWEATRQVREKEVLK